MKITPTKIEGVLILEPKIFHDDRGYFLESYNKKTLKNLGINISFVQDNQSFSKYGTIRGFHYQKGDFSQTKLIRIIQGEILDVVVDVRQNSKTFGQSFAIKLSSQNNLQLFIPKGLAHGFSVLSKEAMIFYKCDNFYNKESESGIIYNDKDLDVDWQVPINKITISQQDLSLQTFKQYRENPCF